MNSQISLFGSLIKKTFLLFLLVILTNLCRSQLFNHGPKYGISYPNTFPKEVVQDIQDLITKSTGKPWQLRGDNSSDAGVQLLLKPDGAYKTGESCQINSDGSSYLRFEAPTTNGLIYGVYKYLRDLGFKFYLPDSLYTIIPKLESIYRKTSRMETPFLRVRDFFGTGGFGSGKTDPGMIVQKSWQLWKWRNGFGAEFQLAGHTGETFNLANPAVLQQHPDWTASPIMKNGKTDPTVKLNYYNDAAVDFFTDWVLKKFTDKNYKAPPAYQRDMVSIEPADGAGFVINPPSGSKLKTVSDQVYHAANVAAGKLDRLFPDRPNIGVNLYAYSGHADVPNFPLNPRVFVQIIPYQFQSVAFGPAFIKRWAGKVKRFGLYDYFKYPDASWDLPGGYSLDQLMNRAINAAQAGSEGTTYESSYSKFATAIPLWVLCQYMCSGDTDWKKNYDQLINDLYGKAASPVKNLFAIFYDRSSFESADLDEAVSYVQSAVKSNQDPAVAARINELGLYLEYTSAYLKSKNVENGELEQRIMPIARIAWSLYQTKIIDSYRIMQLVSYNFLNAKTPDKNLADHYHQLHLLTFPETNDPGAFWKKTGSNQPVEAQIVSKQVNSNRKIVPRSISTIADQLSAAKVSFSPKDKLSIQGSSLVRGYFNLFSEKPATITIDWSLSNPNTAAASATLSGVDKSYKNVYDYTLKGSSGKLSISLPAGESDFFINTSPNTTYSIQVNTQNAWCFFDGSPRGKMRFVNPNGENSYDPAYYPCYIYVPKNTTQVQYRVQVNALKIIDPSGKPVTTNLIKTGSDDFQVRSFAVPEGMDGKFWKAVVSGNFNYQFLNITDRYFLFLEK